MNTQYSRAQYVLLQSVVIALVFIAGCSTSTSTSPLSQQASTSQYNIEGKWSWQQEGPGGPWSGDFVLEKKGDSYVGTLDDTSEGTYGDRISNVQVSNEHIKFTRRGRFGTQDFEGDLKEEEGRLKIIDGQWTDARWPEGTEPLPFSAEKTE
jgi:hypothetical protein